MNATPRLTAAETEVLKLMASGLSYSQIAEARGTCRHTVQQQGYLLFQKIYVKNCFQAALWAWRNGIVSIDDAWATLQAVTP